MARAKQNLEAPNSLQLQMPQSRPYNGLRDFERLLSSMFREVGLIGEIPLSDDEESQIEVAGLNEEKGEG